MVKDQWYLPSAVSSYLIKHDIENRLNEIVNQTVKQMPEDPWDRIGKESYNLSSATPAFKALQLDTYVEGDEDVQLFLDVDARGSPIRCSSIYLSLSEFGSVSLSEIASLLHSEKMTDVIGNCSKSVIYLPEIDKKLFDLIQSLLPSIAPTTLALYLTNKVMSLLFQGLTSTLISPLLESFKKVANANKLESSPPPLVSRNVLSECFGLPSDGTFLTRQSLLSAIAKQRPASGDATASKTPAKGKSPMPPTTTSNNLVNALDAIPSDRDAPMWPFVSVPIMSLSNATTDFFKISPENCLDGTKGVNFFSMNSHISIVIPTEMNSRLIEVASEQIAAEEAEGGVASAAAVSGKKATKPIAAKGKSVSSANIVVPTEGDSGQPFKIPAVSSEIVSLQNALMVGRRIRREVDAIYQSDVKRWGNLGIVRSDENTLPPCPNNVNDIIQIASKAVIQVLGSNAWGGIPSDSVLLGGGLQLNLYLPSIHEDEIVHFANTMCNVISEMVRVGIPMIANAGKSKNPEPPKAVPNAETALRNIIFICDNDHGKVNKVLRYISSSDEMIKKMRNVLEVEGIDIGLGAQVENEKFLTTLKPNTSWLVGGFDSFSSKCVPKKASIPEIMKTASNCMNTRAVFTAPSCWGVSADILLFLFSILPHPKKSSRGRHIFALSPPPCETSSDDPSIKSNNPLNWETWIITNVAFEFDQKLRRLMKIADNKIS
eukprot:GDKJ01021272.1.p1 GENE.GDKJ01021272.1~~GDKJ01021272.1.p1  ORF type:complete len:722 (+),score=145.20 GDKJ01021272.1:24-2168(+)